MRRQWLYWHGSNAGSPDADQVYLKSGQDSATLRELPVINAGPDRPPFTPQPRKPWPSTQPGSIEQAPPLARPVRAQIVYPDLWLLGQSSARGGQSPLRRPYRRIPDSSRDRALPGFGKLVSAPTIRHPTFTAMLA
jgi:hypothetical protein